MAQCLTRQQGFDLLQLWVQLVWSVITSPAFSRAQLLAGAAAYSLTNIRNAIQV